MQNCAILETETLKDSASIWQKDPLFVGFWVFVLRLFVASLAESTVLFSNRRLPKLTTLKIINKHYYYLCANSCVYVEAASKNTVRDNEDEENKSSQQHQQQHNNNTFHLVVPIVGCLLCCWHSLGWGFSASRTVKSLDERATVTQLKAHKATRRDGGLWDVDGSCLVAPHAPAPAVAVLGK